MDIIGLCCFRPAVLYDSDPMNVDIEVVGEWMSLCMEMTIAVTYYSGDKEPEEANSLI